jgi:hypothetical protein
MRKPNGYLVRLPLPLAQSYSWAYNDKDPRSRHNNAFYLFGVLVKLTAVPLVAAYLYGVRHGVQRLDNLDRLLVQLALPSLDQWAGIVRALAWHFGESTEAAHHPHATMVEVRCSVWCTTERPLVCMSPATSLF